MRTHLSPPFQTLFPYRPLQRSGVPCALQQGLISYLFYAWQCVYVSVPISQFTLPPTPLVTISLLSTSVTLFQQRGLESSRPL